MKEQEMTQEEKAKELQEQIAKKALIIEAEIMVEDNTVQFPYEGKTYRMGRPTMRDKAIVNSSKMKKMNELIAGGFPFQIKLIEQLKNNQNVDVPALDIKIIDLQSTINKEQDRLATEVNDKSRELIKHKISEHLAEQYLLIVKKADYLQPSIEAQLYEHTVLMFASILLEVKNEKDEWEKSFKSIDEFMDCRDEVLVNTSIHYVNQLI